VRQLVIASACFAIAAGCGVIVAAILSMAQSDYARLVGGFGLGAFGLACASKAALLTVKAPGALQADLAFLFTVVATIAGLLGIGFYARPSLTTAWAVSAAVVVLLILHLLYCALIAGAAQSGALWRMFALGCFGAIPLLGMALLCSWPWPGPTFMWAALSVYFWGPVIVLPLLAFDLVMVSTLQVVAGRSSHPITSAEGARRGRKEP
jgi:hypothetical protein